MSPTRPRRFSKISRWWKGFAGVLLVYGIVAYVGIPQLQRMQVRRQLDPKTSEHLTKTGTGMAGDPLNLALVGNEADLVKAMLAAGWKPATALGFASSVRIAVDTVIDRPDPDAPVSSLYLYGRKEDLAFEKPVGKSPRERHHVRFWKSPETKFERPLWMGSATHDIGVELSRATGQVTHHIAPQIDEERNLLLSDLESARQTLDIGWVAGYQPVLHGRNGGGDPWHTDGRLPIITLVPSLP